MSPELQTARAVPMRALHASAAPTASGAIYVVVANDGTVYTLTEHYGKWSNWRSLPPLPPAGSHA